jgi:hypothetical protein
MKYLIALLLLPVCASAQTTSTRVTPYDWQCATADGTRISDHARFDTAFVACLNAPTGSLIKGGTYRIGKGVVTPPPPPVLGSVAVSWSLPTKNKDGSNIGAITGFEMEYGTDAQNLIQRVTIPASQTSYTIPGLSPGTWYIRMYVITADGKSDPTNLASKTI